MYRSDREQGGAALISVLWLSVALTLIAASMLMQQRDQIQVTAQQREALQQRYNLQAAEQWFRYQILDSATGAQLNRTFTFNGDNFRLTATPEDFHINLNQADTAALQQLLAGLGLPETEQRTLNDRILDWRDNDQLSRIDGAEQAQYQAMGLNAVPANRPFFDLTELNDIPGITPDLYSQLSPWLSLHSRATHLHPSLRKQLPVAPPEQNVRQRRPPLSNRWRLTIQSDRPQAATSIVKRLAIARTSPFKTLSWHYQPNSTPAPDVQQPLMLKER